MRIEKISVKGLFGLFDHTVRLNLGERITFIHGANGLGKTALLRLLDGVFNSKYSELAAVPFSKFEINFENSTRMSVHKTSKSTKRQQSSFAGEVIHFTYVDKDGTSQEYAFDPDSDDSSSVSLRRQLQESLEYHMPDLERVDVNTWRRLSTGENFTLAEAIIRFQSELPSFYRTHFKEKEWFEAFKKSVEVRFVQTQRLVSINERRSRQVRSEGPSVTPSVQIYSEEIIRAIKDTLTEYAELSQSLDRTFPERLVQQDQEANLSSHELRNRLASLEQKRRGLQAAGLLVDEQGVGFQMPEKLNPTTRKVLSVYVKDVEQKLGVFDLIAAKIDLLRQIVDDRFLYKRMAVHREKGFVFIGDGGQPLLPTSLSSGEQNELVLLYELLFKVKQGALILVDEPEISLHIAWQQQFLKDLQQIIRLSQFDVLIATHSPQIIHDRWDLTVELQGPQQQRRSR